jgi:exportin-T
MTDGINLQEFEMAVMYMFNQSHITDPSKQAEALQIKEQATAYCEQVKKSPDGWRYNLELFVGSQQAEARFYALQTIQELLVANGELALTPERRDQLRIPLIEGLKGGSIQLDQQPIFVRNKLGIVLALLIKRDYPERWPTAFADLHFLIERGPVFLDLHLRLFKAVDEEICAQDSQRSKEEADHNMVVKDAMRATNVVKELFDTWYELLQGYSSSIPELAKLCLSVMEDYICWVDISFVFNQNYVTLFYSFLKIPTLREETCACLEELVSKGMDKRKKLQLLQQLNLVEVLGQLQIDSALLHDDENEDFAEAVSAFVGTQWEELLECMREFESSASSSGSPVSNCHGQGVVVGGEQVVLPPPSPQEADMLLRACGEQLAKQLPLVWSLTRHPNNEISKLVFPILNSVLVLLQKKKATQSSKATVYFDPQAHVVPLLTVVVQKMRYPEDFESNGGWEGEQNEEAAELDMYRRELRKLWVNLVRTAPDESMGFLCTTLAACLRQHALSAQAADTGMSATLLELEVCFTLLHAYGEGRKAADLKVQMTDAANPLAQALDATHSHMLPIGGASSPSGAATGHKPMLHHAVLTPYFELGVRYAVSLAANPSTGQLQMFLEALCGDAGMRHPEAFVRSRSCYLMNRLARTINGTGGTRPRALLPYIDAVLGALLELMTMNVGVGDEAKSFSGEGAATRFLSDGMTSTSGGSKRKASGQAQAKRFLSVEDQLFLFEVAGQLVGSLSTAEQQLPYLEAVIRPQLQQLEVGCTLAQQLVQHKQQQGGGSDEERTLGESIANVIAAVAQFSKGFKSAPEALQPVFSTFLDAIGRLIHLLPGAALFRSKTIFFLHRMVLLLGRGVLPFYPPILSALITHSDAQGLVELSILMNQSAIKFGVSSSKQGEHQSDQK